MAGDAKDHKQVRGHFFLGVVFEIVDKHISPDVHIVATPKKAAQHGQKVSDEGDVKTGFGHRLSIRGGIIYRLNL